MKKFILPYIGLICLIGCLSGCDNTPRLFNMQKSYPNADFTVNPELEHQYIVRKEDNSVWAVHSYNRYNIETHEVLLIPAPKK